MPIQSLAIDRFRNLEPTELKLSSQLNLFTGENAAGKTSLLEALYVLARGRSFRTRQLDKLVQGGEQGFRIVAWLEGVQGRKIPVGLERDDSRLICRINGRPAKRLSELAALFPVQWLGGNLHAVVDDGPVYRRQVLDWGLFHVKPAYMETWKRFQKLLKQRNAALRQGREIREIKAWDKDFVAVGEQLDSYRGDYLRLLLPELGKIQSRFPTLEQGIEIKYRRGWSDGVAYAESLHEGFKQDRESGFTRLGPHRAELAFSYGGKPARERLSRGQQKVFITALQLAQAILLYEQTGKTSLFLLDDLTAELDITNQKGVMEILRTINAQVFVTSISDVSGECWGTDEIKRFHVKHGSVSEVI